MHELYSVQLFTTFAIFTAGRKTSYIPWCHMQPNYMLELLTSTSFSVNESCHNLSLLAPTENYFTHAADFYHKI